MNRAVKIHHPLGDVSITLTNKVNATRLKQVIRTALDDYLDEVRVRFGRAHV